jgi:hypothetical protein
MTHGIQQTGPAADDAEPIHGRIPANPRIPCHVCGQEERFMEMKRSGDWTLEYLDDGSGQWVAYCAACTTGEDQ